MTAPAGLAPAAPGVPSPSPTSTEALRTVDSWAPADQSAAAFHLRSLGASEGEALAILTSLAYGGVRRVSAYVGRFTEADLRRWLEARDAAERAAFPGSHKRGDLLTIRGRARWPWRVSTGGPS